MTANFSLFALTLYALGYAMLFAALLLVSYYPPAGGAGTTLTVWLYTALGTLSGHMLGNAQGKKLDVAPDPQGGFASVRLLIVLAAVSLGLVLAGCAGLNAQGVLTITYNTPTATTSATLVPGAQAPAIPASAAKP